VNGIKSLDWRFLLPTPTRGRFERLVLAGATEAKAELVSAAGVAADVSRDLDGRRSADAVVCLGGTRVDLEQAAATLRPAGVLYVEVERGGARAKPLRTLRRLHALGLRVVGVYWPHPGFELPNVYLPLDAPGAVDWYFRNSFVIRTARARLFVAPVRFGAAALHRRLAHLVPRVSFVAVAGADGIAPSVLSSPALPPALRQPGVRPLVLMSGGEWSRVVMLPFAPGARQPLAAVKLWRIRGREEHLDRERRGQQLVRELLDPELRDAVPAPLGVVEWSGLVGNVEECAPGEWLFARRHRTRRLSSSLRELHVVAGWLTSFNARAQIDHGRWTDEDVERWVSGPIAQYRRAFGPSPDEERLFSAAERRATELTGVRLPYVWCHNDFSELNLYCGRDSVGVVDWETIAPGLPASDLLHYVQRWFYRAQRETRDEGRSFHSLFLAPSARGRAVQAGRAALASYGARLDLDERFFALLLTTEWIRRAVARHARSAPQGNGARSARRNRFAQYVEILAQHVPMLFESRYRWGQA
jgi:aminoglycoside phosphotransferase (APT) family kinase protein